MVAEQEDFQDRIIHINPPLPENKKIALYEQKRSRFSHQDTMRLAAIVGDCWQCIGEFDAGKFRRG